MKPTYYKSPSIKRLTESLNLSKEQAMLVRGLIKGEVRTIDNPQFPVTQAWIASCYSRPARIERIMSCINEVIGAHGCEAIWGSSVTQPIAEYCNSGDTYATTILFNYQTDVFSITSLGDFVERNQSRYSIA